MKIFTNPPKSEWAQILKRPTTSLEDIEDTVISIFDEIAQQGDKAVQKYTKQFDKATLENNVVSPSEIETAKTRVSIDLKKAINNAKENIEKFHRAQITERVEVETTEGVLCWQEKRKRSKKRCC